MLKRHGVHTLFVDEQTGVDSEKSLNTLLDMAETADIFGAGVIMEMKALLVVQVGPNLRNDTAHGLLDNNSAWSYTALYLWWFCLRLVMWPVIQMVDRAIRQNGDSATGSRGPASADADGDDSAATDDTDNGISEADTS